MSLPVSTWCSSLGLFHLSRYRNSFPHSIILRIHITTIVKLSHILEKGTFFLPKVPSRKSPQVRWAEREAASAGDYGDTAAHSPLLLSSSGLPLLLRNSFWNSAPPVYLALWTQPVPLDSCGYFFSLDDLGSTSEAHDVARDCSG